MFIQDFSIYDLLKKFIHDSQKIKLQFNDYHVIFCSEVEKILVSFIDQRVIYIETANFKLNITLDKIQKYKVINSKSIIYKLYFVMKDGAVIVLIRE